MKLAALIEKLAKKANIDTTLLALPSTVTDVDVPDEIADKLDKALMTIDAAKNHPQIRQTLRSEILDGVDKRVGELLEEFGIEDVDDITNEKNSFNKIALFGKKIQALEAKKATTHKTSDKAEIEKQIADLNKQLKAEKDAFVVKEKEWQTTRESDLTDFEIQKILLGKDYALPKEMDVDLKVTTAKSAIEKALSEKGFKIVRDPETKGLKIVNKENLPAYSESNEPLQINSFVDGALARNKLLKVNDPNNPGDKGPNAPVIHSGDQGKGNAQAVAAIDAQMNELFPA